MKYVMHREDCSGPDYWAFMLVKFGLRVPRVCCDGPKKFANLMTAARDLIRGGHAMGALEQAVEAIEKCDD